MKGYKLLDENMRARKGFQYELNKPIIFDAQPIICRENCLHLWDDDYLASIMVNLYFTKPRYTRMFECDTLDGIIVNEFNLKFGSNQLVLTKEIDPIILSDDDKIRFMILCVKQCKPINALDRTWHQWADDWLNDVDRSTSTALKTLEKYHSIHSLMSIEASVLANVAFSVDKRIGSPRDYDVAGITFLTNKRGVDVHKIIKQFKQ